MNLKSLSGRFSDRTPKCRIYAITMVEDPEDSPLYIGSTCGSLEARFRSHMRCPSPSLLDVIRRVGGVENLRIVELLKVEESERFKREEWVIRLARGYGHELANRATPWVEKEES